MHLFRFFKVVSVLFCVCFFCLEGAAQKKNSVEFFARIFLPADKKRCDNFQPGSVVLYKKPAYPENAQKASVGGIVEFRVRISETGVVSEMQKVSGHPLFDAVTRDAAGKIRFSPTLCGSQPRAVFASLFYAFLPGGDLETYFTALRVEDYADITEKSQYYEPVMFLTKNHNLTHGFSDRKFHPELPLTNGDFAYFLNATLGLLSNRARTANKTPSQIKLYANFNPQKLGSPEEIRAIDKRSRYYESVRDLFRNYKIALVDKNREFHGDVPISNAEVLKLWRNIFGDEAIPVNFNQIPTEERIMTRGEFALFLRESLEVLLYKVLP